MKKFYGLLLIISTQAVHAQKLNVPRPRIQDKTIIVTHDTIIANKHVIDTVWNHYQNGDFVNYSEKKVLIDTIPYNLLEVRTTTVFEYDDRLDTTTTSKYIPKK